MMGFLQLGASLYVPATRSELAAIGNGIKYPALRSVIYCTEDAIHAQDVPLALHNLASALPRLEPAPLLRFVRARNPEVLRAVLEMDGARHLTGFVIPKATRHNLHDYFRHFRPDDPYLVMITLETVEVFDPVEMAALRDLVLQARYRERLLSLRIGGNDLLHLLGLRRPRQRTIHTTPLGAVIAQLVTIFRPHGLNLTGPVCEWLNRDELLAREVRLDLARGLFGKSAIHPAQVPVIEAEYRVSRRDLCEAGQILSAGAPPVFRLNEAMAEPATHHAWATLIQERARLYGVHSAASAEIGSPVGR